MLLYATHSALLCFCISLRWCRNTVRIPIPKYDKTLFITCVRNEFHEYFVCCASFHIIFYFCLFLLVCTEQNSLSYSGCIICDIKWITSLNCNDWRWSGHSLFACSRKHWMFFIYLSLLRPAKHRKKNRRRWKIQNGFCCSLDHILCMPRLGKSSENKITSFDTSEHKPTTAPESLEYLMLHFIHSISQTPP